MIPHIFQRYLFCFSFYQIKDLKKIILSKYDVTQGPAVIFQHLNGGVRLISIKCWCKMIREFGIIQLSTSPG